MSKVASFYDWELNFKKKPSSKQNSPIAREDVVNSLGIPESIYKNFLNEWKKKNL